MLSVSAIRGFLLQSPKPFQVKVTTDDGDEKLLRVKNFAKAAESIHALSPALIECLDKDGALLRAKKGEDSAEAHGDAVDLPASLANEPLAAAFMVYARHLANAYVHSTDVAFARMAEMWQAQNERSESIERRLERAEGERRRIERDMLDDQWERADEAAETAAAKAEEGTAEQQLQRMMFESFMAGQRAKGAKAAAGKPSSNGAGTNGASNGKGTNHDA